MIRRKPIVLGCIGIAAAGPFFDLSPSLSCNPRIDLCGASKPAYLPDEQAPEHAPALIFEPQAAASLSSVSVGNVLYRSNAVAQRRYRALSGPTGLSF